MSKIHNIHDVAFDISSLAIQAVMYEVTCYPSPGLVSFISNGAHKDMDYYTFIDSTSSLIKYLTLCVEEGLKGNDYKEIFLCLKELGKNAEIEMYKKTGGVNTHKGMLFLMGICCGAIGIAIRGNKEFCSIRNIISNMTKGLVEKELEPILKSKHLIENGRLFGRALSYGEKLYVEHNIKGVRGEVEEGLPIVFDFAMATYKENYSLSKNERLVHTLIEILRFNQDTNIIHRHSVEVLEEVHKKVDHISKIGGMATEEGKKAIEILDKEFIDRNISPGGTADILAVTVFLCLVEEYMNKDSISNQEEF